MPAPKKPPGCPKSGSNGCAHSGVSRGSANKAPHGGTAKATGYGSLLGWSHVRAPREHSNQSNDSRYRAHAPHSNLLFDSFRHFLHGHLALINLNSLSTGASFRYCGFALIHWTNIAATSLREGVGLGMQTRRIAFLPEFVAR